MPPCHKLPPTHGGGLHSVAGAGGDPASQRDCRRLGAETGRRTYWRADRKAASHGRSPPFGQAATGLRTGSAENGSRMQATRLP